MPSYTSLFVFAALAVSCSAFPAKAPSHSQILLPKPTGSYQVGLEIAELIDHSRTQPFAPRIEPVRLMVSVFYPVPHNQHHTIAAAYMPPETALFEDAALSQLGLAAPNGTFEKLALQLASPEPTDRASCHFPLVIFLPGQGTTRLFYNQIASTIASLGYTVVTIDAPYDVDIVQYPDSSFAKSNNMIWQTDDVEAALATAYLAVQTRIQDTSFVLDSLSNANFAHSLIPNLSPSGLNTTHVAIVGHSLGGAAAYSILGVEDRIIGGFNMDGVLFGPGVPAGTTKPFMLMGHANYTRENKLFGTWKTAWTNLTGWKRDVLVAETDHYDFSDYPLVFEKLGIMPQNETVREGLLLGIMRGDRQWRS